MSKERNLRTSIHDVMLKIENLSVTAEPSGRELVNISSFQLENDSICMIVGSSGSGKSLTLRSIMGLLPKSSYTVTGIFHYNGNLVEQNRSGFEKLRGTEIAMVFQDAGAHLNPLMSVADHLKEIWLHHNPTADETSLDAEIRALLTKVRLAESERIAASYPHQLSGGQKQRVMIAMALAARPRLILADEPTSALDPSVQREIIDLLISIKRETGISILMVTHDMPLALNVADQIYVMDGGRIVEQFAPAAFEIDRLAPEARRLLMADRTAGDAVALSIQPVPILEVSALCKRYPNSGTVALGPISFSLQKGRTLAIIGESGSGKSTLARILAGLIPPTEGTFCFPAQEAGQSRAAAVQMVFQDPATSLDPERRVSPLLVETMRINGIGNDDAERVQHAVALLSRVGLSAKIMDRLPAQLSGGERQRVAIARALSVRPQLIILDESLSALDVHVQAEVIQLLSDLRRSFALTMIFITHELTLAARFADEVIVLQDGKIVEKGECATVLDTPGSAYTRRLVDAQYRFEPAM